MRSAAFLALLLGFAPPAGAQPRPAAFWEQVLDPEAEICASLVDRARQHLDPAALGGLTSGGLARARALLDEALQRNPRHFRAALLRGEALALEGRTDEAVTALGRACALGRGIEEESACASRLALAESRAGRYAEALAHYDQQIRLGRAGSAAHANAAEVAMALDRLPDAIARYREAVRLARAQATAGRDADLALACYGLAVALDRDEQAAPAREAMTRAVALDPGLRLLDAAAERHAEVFFVPPGDAHYYRALALELSGRAPAAIEAFRRFLATRPAPRFAARAAAHLAAFGAAAVPAPAPPAPHLWRIVAAATVKTDGPILAPLVDAAWKSRPRLAEPCLESAPALDTATVRVALDLVIDAQGAVTKVVTTAPPAWTEVPACLEARVTGNLRLPRPSKAAPTKARVELVLSLHP